MPLNLHFKKKKKGSKSDDSLQSFGAVPVPITETGEIEFEDDSLADLIDDDDDDSNESEGTTSKDDVVEEAMKNKSVLTFATRTGEASEQGVHGKNDDCARAGWWCNCFVISDGIGGAPDGDYMSRVGCGAALEAYEQYRDVEQAFTEGNLAALVVSQWIDNPNCGATLLVAALEGDKMRFAWCGDSVAYRLRDGVLSLLTSPERESGTNVLKTAIGYDPDLVPSTTEIDVQEGDRFLLCTDGVWSSFDKRGLLGELMHLMEEDDNAPLIASRICKEARRIGTDDASAVVVIIDRAETLSVTEPPKPSVVNSHTPPPAVDRDIDDLSCAITEKIPKAEDLQRVDSSEEVMKEDHGVLD